VIGLWLESVLRDRPITSFQPHRPSIIRQIPRALRQSTLAVGFLLFVLVLSKDRYLSRLFLFTLIPVLYTTLLLSGHFLPRFLAQRLFRGSREERMILVGSLKRASKIRDWLLAKQAYGFHTVGILTEDQKVPNSWPAILGPSAQLESVLCQYGVTQVILLQLPEATSGFDALLRSVHRRGVRLVILSNLDEQLHHPVFTFEDDGLSFFTFHLEPLENPFHRLIKRLLDLVIAIPATFIAFPLAALFVKIVQVFQSPGPLLYRQTWVGVQNRSFEILKFRTMHTDTGEPTSQATAGDPRIFPVGRFLRRLGIDEIPQFLNVLKGNMSVVGPRPHLVEHNDKFAELLSNYHTRAFVKPGITGLAQVRGFRCEATTREAIGDRLQSDLIYLENWSLILDLSIIVRTLWHVFVPSNCCPTESKQITEVDFSTERGPQQREEPGKGAIPATDHLEKIHPKSYFGSLWDDGEFPKPMNHHASKRSGDLS
jgi:exopolysaccharide biosynthesis polyprenyl glycosylphosphotransferase